MADGRIFFGDQKMTRREALASYTVNAARAAFEEDSKGTLAPGKLADLVVLSRNILAIDDDEIPGTKVDYTILNGKVVFARR